MAHRLPSKCIVADFHPAGFAKMRRRHSPTYLTNDHRHRCKGIRALIHLGSSSTSWSLTYTINIVILRSLPRLGRASIFETTFAWRLGGSCEI